MTSLLRTRGAALTLALSLALILSGCGGSGDAASDDAEAVETNEVDLPRSYKFAPERIAVAAGEEVTWTNSDQFTHNVVLLEPERVEVGTMAPGEAVSHTFGQPGTYAYQCTLHPRDMNGEVVVAAGAK